MNRRCGGEPVSPLEYGCERCGAKEAHRHRGRGTGRHVNVVHSHHGGLFLDQFVFTSSPRHLATACTSWAAYIPRVAHLLAHLARVDARICTPASLRTSTRRAIPPPAQSTRHVTASLPQAVSFVRLSASVASRALKKHTTQHTQLPHPLRAYHVSSRSTAHA